LIERLLSELQEDIPVVERPFLYLARRTGMREEEVLDHLKTFRKKGLLRHFGPIYDASSFGYDSALVAFEIRGDLAGRAGIIGEHPGVSHCYEREGKLNLWFTIAVPPDSGLGLDRTVEVLAKRTGAVRWGIFRKVRTFKLRVRLDFDSLAEREGSSPSGSGSPVEADEEVRRTVVLTQSSLPLIPEPFAELAKRDGLSQNRILKILTYLKERGAMRRFSAVLNHRKAGFRANALTLWQIPRERVQEAGKLLSSFRSVSHCYERSFRGNFDWHYNLFAMIHGRTREEVLSFAHRLAEEIKPIDFRALFSEREFVKRRVRLFTEDYYEWERGSC